MLTLYALFGDDLRLAIFPKGADTTFNIVTIMAMLVFFVEILLQSIAIEGYFMGLYFWLDFVSTVSLITDIGWVWDSVTGS